MMGGLNLSDGVKRMAEAGGKQYFASKAEASKAINAAEDAQDAFNQYQMSYKQGNKKMIGEMYGKWQSSMLDFQGKIQAAATTAAAHITTAEAALKQRGMEHTENMQRYKDERLERSREFDIRIKQNDRQFQDTIAQRKDDALSRTYHQFNQDYANLTGKLSAESNNLQKQFENKLMMSGLPTDPSKFTPAQKNQYTALVDDFTAKKAEFIDPISQQRDEVQQNLLSLQAKVLGKDFIGSDSEYKVRR